MPILTVFYNERADGGVRTGVEWDGELVLHRYVPASDDDPALILFIDAGFRVRASAAGKNVQEFAAQTLRSYAQQALSSAAESLNAGIDLEAWPVQREFRIDGAAGRLTVTVTCSCNRRTASRTLAAKLREFARGWTRTIEAMRSRSRASAH